VFHRVQQSLNVIGGAVRGCLEIVNHPLTVLKIDPPLYP
jgi:hypothetical protein